MKYELTNNTITHLGRTLYQIKALKDFGNVKKSDLGGWIEKEDNLSHHGNAWVFDNACISDNACVSGNARVSGNACVSDNAYVLNNKSLLTIELLDDNRVITLTKSNKKIKAGCFCGSYEEFEKLVNDKYKKRSDYHIFLPTIKEWLNS